ncbi:MAG: hypothetical protein A3K59_07880 [Euryarchaeota archaeon RBG_19FT_COMBO_69_17]|nr:MAG: hypothetical protein A3K59_07880 [Euryarchaeota archaeon RBG_19FT_COMBO_69_17]
MMSERVRAVLGVWMPLVLGLLIIGTAVNFYVNSTLVGGFLEPDLEPWRLVCSAGAFVLGAIMILSTYGRFKKAREARMEEELRAAPPKS